MALAIGLALGSASAFAEMSPLDLSSGSAGFENSPAGGGFMDGYTFSALSSFTFSSSITSVVNGNRNLNFSSITLTGPAGLFSFNKTLGDPFELWTLQTGTLAPGSYSLTLLGLNSSSPASYGGNVSISAVPEPETYALMLAGVGVIGFVATRRRRRV
ncbi:MAG: FxDxF family PEP-CTERM protein [Pseudomonadota bacterium]|nr:FxDxF family PEP-CTERM protein [Pseudomonadota bacterium]